MSSHRHFGIASSRPPSIERPVARDEDALGGCFGMFNGLLITAFFAGLIGFVYLVARLLH